MKHTRGPWHIKRDSFNRIEDNDSGMLGSIVSKEDFYIATIEDADEAEGNAHLLAAAPKLLKALDHALTALCDATPSSKYTAIKKEGFAAIKEAEGDK